MKGINLIKLFMMQSEANNALFFNQPWTAEPAAFPFVEKQLIQVDWMQIPYIFVAYSSIYIGCIHFSKNKLALM